MQKVCVLLSTYNGEKFLEELLNSVINQNGVEVILFARDDGSSDKTKEILLNFKNNHLYNNIIYEFGENLGFSKSFSCLIKNAPKADYYACCDQDDVWLPNKLKNAVEEIEKAKNKNQKSIPILFHTNCIIVDENLNEITHKSHEHYSRNTDKRFEESLLMTMINGCTAVFNNELRELYCHIPPEKIFAHDYTLCTLASAFGQVVFSENSQILYRQHGNNLYGFYKSSLRNLLRTFKNFFKHELKHLRYNEALIYKDIFYNQLSEENKNFIDLITNYKKRMKDRKLLKSYIKKNIDNKTIRSYSLLLINLGKL